MPTLACPNCKTINPWNGDLVDYSCQRCGKPIQVQALAQSLVHLFCNDAVNIDGGDEGFEERLFKAIASSLWGKGAGRWGWWYANCPTTLDALREALRQDNDLIVSPLMGFLVGKQASQALVKYYDDISAAAITALERQPDSSVRWSLYTLIEHYPSANAIPVINAVRKAFPQDDGNESSPIGRAASAAAAKCQNGKAEPSPAPYSSPAAGSESGEA